MRTTLLLPFALPFALAACTADIAPDTYFCGPERLCPEGLTCNDADNICTAPSNVEAFGCGKIDGIPIPDMVGDDTPADGFDITNVNTCLVTRELRACLFADDPGDWVQFDLPAVSCSGTYTMTGRVTFAIAFEPLAIQLSTDDGPPQTVDVECDKATDSGGQTQRCFEVQLAGGSHYAIGVVHGNTANCDGDCAHNRYVLDLRMSQ